jgi:16S rRNA G966 N2-methylase RsmD
VSSEHAVSTFQGPYDLILLDPPYEAEGVQEVVEQLAASRLMARSGIVVWEHRRSNAPPDEVAGPDGEVALRLLRTRTHGAASVSLYASVVKDSVAKN